MIINMESLARLYTGFTAVFNAAFQETQTWYVRVAMTVPANTRIMDYKFLLDFPMVREWIGDRQISSLEPKAFQVETKDWEATIEVDRNDIEDDQLGFYNPIVAALAQARGFDVLTKPEDIKGPNAGQLRQELADRKVRVLFMVDSWFKLGLALLPEDQPMNEQALREAVVRELSKIDMTALGTASHWLKGRHLTDQDIQDELVRRAIERRLAPHDLKLLVDLILAKRGWIHDVSKEAHVKVWPPEKYIEQATSRRTVPEGIRDIEEPELLLYYGTMYPDVRKVWELLELVTPEARRTQPGEKPAELETLFLKRTDTAVNAAYRKEIETILEQYRPERQEKKSFFRSLYDIDMPGTFRKWGLLTLAITLGRLLLQWSGLSLIRRQLYKKKDVLSRAGAVLIDLVVPPALKEREANMPGPGKRIKLLRWLLFHSAIFAGTLLLTFGYVFSQNPIVFAATGWNFWYVIAVNLYSSLVTFYLLAIIVDLNLKFISHLISRDPILPEQYPIKHSAITYVARISELDQVLDSARRSLEGLRSTPSPGGGDPLDNMKVIFDAGTSDGQWPQYKAIFEAAWNAVRSKGPVVGLAKAEDKAKPALFLWMKGLIEVIGWHRFQFQATEIQPFAGSKNLDRCRKLSCSLGFSDDQGGVLPDFLYIFRGAMIVMGMADADQVSLR